MKFFGIIGVLLLLVWYVPAMLWGVQITQAMNSFQRGEAGSFEGLLDGPAPLAWWRNRSELKETFDPQELNTRRKVSLEVRMPFAELLKPGEDMPPGEVRDLYAAARAPARLQPYCAELLAALATRCDSVATEGRVRDGEAVLEGWLMYVPAYDMGDPSGVETGDMFSARAQLTETGEIENTPEGRAEVISRALTVCDALREVFGNCVISGLSLGHARYGGQTAKTGYFDVYASKTRYNRDTVQAKVEEVAAAVLGATQ